MNVYKYETYTFEHGNNKGTLYNNGKIMFMGNGWSGILAFLNATNNAPEVREMFKAQLEQREKPRYTKTERKVEPEVTEPPKPKSKNNKLKSQWDRLTR